MTPEKIFQTLQDELGEEVVFDFNDGTGDDKDPWCKVESGRIDDVATKLKTDPALHFDYMECLTGIDFPDDNQIGVTYHLCSYVKKHRIVLKCLLDRDDPVIPTLTNVWRAALWQERECFDLLGVMFDGHPDLRRILLPDDWEGHPLRKDWTEKAEYHGIPTTRVNTLDLLGAKPHDADAAPKKGKKA